MGTRLSYSGVDTGGGARGAHAPSPNRMTQKQNKKGERKEKVKDDTYRKKDWTQIRNREFRALNALFRYSISTKDRPHDDVKIGYF